MRSASSLARILRRAKSSTRAHSSSTRPPILTFDKTNVYPFGRPSNDPSTANFRSLSWAIRDAVDDSPESPPECWAIIGSSLSAPNKAALMDVVLGRARFDPRESAKIPILDTLPLVSRPKEQGGPRLPDIEDFVKLVTFRTRLAATGGDFQDHTARYFAIRDEDKLTVQDHLKDSVPYSDDPNAQTPEEQILAAAKSLQMDDFLQLPLVTLSNGQTRRARILRALLSKPQLLLLEEPFTGLDVASRALLSGLLQELHTSRNPRVLLSLRPQDELPPWVSHIALVGDEPGAVKLGIKDEILALPEAQALLEAGAREREEAKERAKRRRLQAAGRKEEGKVLVDLKQVNVRYSDRHVLKNIDWKIREGERWLLAGHNGSGKSTLLSVLLGDHPRSYTEDIELFGKPRIGVATSTIQSNIGHVSPEIFNAFPRKFGPEGLTAREAIVTGFESIYSYRKMTSEQDRKLNELVEDLGHPSLTPAFLDRLFAELSAGDQSLVLLLRALCKSPPLLVLDEPFSGMNKETIDCVKRFLDKKLLPHQAVIVISHFEEELPDSISRGLRLERGAVVEKW